jgi:outer membrane receptor protein involved in Fe transport
MFTSHTPLCPDIRRHPVIFAAVLLGLLLPTAGRAQAIAPAAGTPGTAVGRNTSREEDTLVLSPFVVTAEDDNGYQATSTLAGTRLRTNLNDVGGAISVLTAEFLKDTNVHNVNELLTYTTGTEAAGPEGNFTGGQPAGTGIDALQDVDSVRRRPQTATRVRGLGSADLTRDYFLTEIPFDDYNVERVEISRGPNAILFGLGSPAGIVNYGLRKPTFHPRTELGTEIASFGSFRATLDSNQVLIPNRLAARLSGLHKDEQFEQEPTYEKDNRGYLAVDFRPFTNSILRLNAEVGRTRAARPNLTSPFDNISVWLASAPAGSRETWNASTQAATAEFERAIGTQEFFFQWATIWGDPAAAAPTMDGVQGRRVAPAPRIDFRGGRNLAEPASTLRLQGFTDRSVFDFRHQLLAGNESYTTADFHALGASWEQTVLNRDAGIELSFNRQSYSDQSFGPVGDQATYGIRVDVNNTLPDGRANPNLGRPFVLVTPKMNEGETKRTSWRATAYYELDLRKKLSNRLGSILGRHVLTGLLDREKIENRNVSWSMQWGEVGANSRIAANLNNPLNGFRRRVTNLVYLGPSILNAGSVSDVRINTYPSTPIWQPNAIFPIRGWDVQTGSWLTQQAQEIALPAGGTVDRQEIDSKAVVLQSYWLDRSIVTTVGWRNDESKTYSLVPLPLDANGGIIFDQFTPPANPTTVLGGDAVSYSVVGHLPWTLPMNSKLSVHYSTSENFQPLSQRTNLFGAGVGAPSGKTKEYGLSLRLLDDKLNLRVNWFETTVANESNGDATNLAWNVVVNQGEFVALNFLNDLLVNGLTTKARVDEFGLPPQALIDFLQAKKDPVTGIWSTPGGSGRTSVSSRKSRGLEWEAIYNPTTNWRMMFNVARQETLFTGAGAEIVTYADLRRPFWKKIYDLPRGLGGIPFGTWYESVLEVPLRTLTSQDGRVSPEQRKWRANFVTNYEFSADRLRGVGVGGAVRWQDKAAIGYPLKTNADNQLVSDIDNPYFAPTELNSDVWLSYRRLLRSKVDWTIKLTVRNVLRNRDLIPISTQPDGSFAQVRVAPVTTWQLTNSFAF